ncbi:hypothetical protein NDI56_16650 [Haloarcula sp. S1CR25-12]|uniref:DUF3883 domain-containing protein n=1 Tax=Haloarcula saliterrae TaxID=2950534 RepID=A0ABU2FGV6_9EURY|nr:hypothetical protein [Haloarcula sp. S1CR25-12]MDS0261031.1 hypothetical protein [Haloarcula sp. S1CR25-12]
MLNARKGADVPTGTSPSTVRRAGKIDRRLPDTNVKTGQIAGKLDEMPGARRERVSNQFDQLDGSTKNHFKNVDGRYNPASEATDLFENTGPSGRRALNEPTDSDGEAADVLLRMDDAATQWRFTKAYESDAVDSDELGTALRRYDGLDSDGKAEYRRFTETTGNDGVGFVTDLNSDQVSDFFGSACRRAPSVAAPPRFRSDRLHSVAQHDTLALTAGGCADDLSALAKQRYYNNIADAASENSDISASEIFDQVEDVSDADRRRTLKQLFADSGEDGIRLARDMDSGTKEAFLDLGTDNQFGTFNRFDDWRSNVAKSGVDTAEARRYTERVDRAGDHENIDGAEELVKEVADNPTQVPGQSGEAASALRYADNTNRVKMEPGNGEYDLAVTRGGDTEYVEVKTRTRDDVTENWVRGKITDINEKFESAQENGLDIGDRPSDGDSVLELRVPGDSSDLDDVRSTVQNAIEDRNTVHADEIRIVTESGATEIITNPNQ